MTAIRSRARPMMSRVDFFGMELALRLSVASKCLRWATMSDRWPLVKAIDRQRSRFRSYSVLKVRAKVLLQLRAWLESLTSSSSLVSTSFYYRKSLTFLKFIGMPKMIDRHIMNNKRFVLTQREDKVVQLWKLDELKMVK